MDNKEELNNTLKFYFNPLEPIRMLRYFPFQTDFSNLQIIEEQIYKQEPKIGYSLFLNNKSELNDVKEKIEFLKENIIVFYFKNEIQKEIIDYLDQKNIERIEQPNKLFHHENIGDLNEIDSLFQSLLWAKEKQLDILVRVDLNTENLNKINKLKELAFKTDGLTFSEYEKEWKNFDISLLGLNVKYWNLPQVVYSFKWLLENECSVELITWIHEIAKILSGNNYSQKYQTYLNENKIPYIYSGYVNWKGE